jgi:toxin ParE1/3/4
MKLGHAPSIGTARPELGEGVRMLPHGHYLIFYREHEPTLRSERVKHSARDIAGDDFELGD